MSYYDKTEIVIRKKEEIRWDIPINDELHEKLLFEKESDLPYMMAVDEATAYLTIPKKGESINLSKTSDEIDLRKIIDVKTKENVIDSKRVKTVTLFFDSIVHKCKYLKYLMTFTHRLDYCDKGRSGTVSDYDSYELVLPSTFDEMMEDMDILKRYSELSDNEKQTYLNRRCKKNN